ncbi:uncharacterized protein LAESUDRAFT_763592 [Laetiporus sulphureus 93-53]|uniref:Uncharacterized protein n=1 Tax=Laetiporus sulphureus 93-53 TaxID=1314785 RepID=A0A165BSU4_9APHY|nr:uncharacterized protein LAESUDRAFT_763592 [Laetiporus sulphureus 93-53]KZT01584.1 hypothetical protein LAESUDRAFT_763592 [Laetiporus sulphureus 93-53]
MAHIYPHDYAADHHKQLKVTGAQIGSLLADIERLIKMNNNVVLEAQSVHKDFEDYNNEEKTTIYIVGLKTQLNNTIINAPPGISQSAD